MPQSGCRPANWSHELRTNQTARKETTMLKLAVRYARYALAALSSVGFGLSLN